MASLADEMSVDVEVVVGKEAEILVSLPVKIEHDAISSDEPRILAHASRLIASCITNSPVTTTNINNYNLKIIIVTMYSNQQYIKYLRQTALQVLQSMSQRYGQLAGQSY